MLDRVANEVLEELFQTASIGADRPVRSGDERCLRRLDVRPTAFDHRCEIDRFHLGHGLSLASEREEVVDEGVHSIVRSLDGRQVLPTVGFLCQFELSLGHI